MYLTNQALIYMIMQTVVNENNKHVYHGIKQSPKQTIHTDCITAFFHELVVFWFAVFTKDWIKKFFF